MESLTNIWNICGLKLSYPSDIKSEIILDYCSIANLPPEYKLSLIDILWKFINEKELNWNYWLTDMKYPSNALKSCKKEDIMLLHELSGYLDIASAKQHDLYKMLYLQKGQIPESDMLVVSEKDILFESTISSYVAEAFFTDLSKKSLRKNLWRTMDRMEGTTLCCGNFFNLAEIPKFMSFLKNELEERGGKKIEEDIFNKFFQNVFYGKIIKKGQDSEKILKLGYLYSCHDGDIYEKFNEIYFGDYNLLIKQLPCCFVEISKRNVFIGRPIFTFASIRNITNYEKVASVGKDYDYYKNTNSIYHMYVKNMSNLFLDMIFSDSSIKSLYVKTYGHNLVNILNDVFSEMIKNQTKIFEQNKLGHNPKWILFPSDCTVCS